MVSNMVESQSQWMRTLPNGKAISALGFGCSSLWAKPGFCEVTAQLMLDVAVAQGINHFDTSPSYGAGTGERRLGDFLKKNNPEKFVISTKVGTNYISGKIVRGFNSDLLRRSFDESLNRLGLQYVDILYLHGPSCADLTDDVFRFFDDQKTAGRIRYSGVNSFDNKVLDYCVDKPIDAVMLQYNAGDFRNYSQLVKLSGTGKLIFSATVLAQATFRLSTFLPRNRQSLWYLLRALRKDPFFVVRGQRLLRRLQKFGPNPEESMIRFLTNHPKILSGLFGTSKIAHIRENALFGKRTMTSDEWSKLYASLQPVT
jgi:D-threo-aldose 1-dehydrogenase